MASRVSRRISSMVRLLLVSQAVAFIVPQPRHQQSTSLWAAREKAAAPAKAIAVVGEPGSGQTTFANMLAEKLGVSTASVSDEGMTEKLRAKMMGGKSIGSFQKAMSDVMVERVAGLQGEGKGVVLDGWPRSPADLQGLLAQGVSLERVVYLDTGDEDDGQPELTEMRGMLGPRVVTVENDDRGIPAVFEDVLAKIGAPAAKDDAAAAAAPKATKAKKAAAPTSPAVPAAERDSRDLMFGGLLVTGEAAASLRERGIQRATPIQEAAMVRIRRGDHVLIHAETGSGKTLAYTLPVLQRLNGHAPRQVMVVTPTRELAVQVAGEIVALQGHTHDVALLLDPTTGLGKLEAPIVVGTAKMLYAEMTASNRSRAAMADVLSNLQCVIMDEVDRCISPLGAYATLKDKRQRMRHPKPASLFLTEIYTRQGLTPQFVGASATIGRPLKREIAACMGVEPKLGGPVTIRADEPPPDANVDSNKVPNRAVSIPASIRHFYLPVPDDDIEQKVRAVRDYVNDKRPKRPVVFLPAALSVTDVTMRLARSMESHGWDVCALHDVLGFGGSGKGTATDWRDAVAKHREVAALSSPLARAENESTRLLVTSAESARGLDLAGVDCVIVFGRVDGPDEYQHVAGRTGRQGARGVVVSVLSYVDVKKLSAFEAMLGIHFRQAVMGNGPMR